ncbi:hypothetical protein [Rhizobium ecuadorense]|nr:hypothetical protein [Rhizobium ecuadorense]
MPIRTKGIWSKGRLPFRFPVANLVPLQEKFCADPHLLFTEHST